MTEKQKHAVHGAETDAPGESWVLFDGTCGFCTAVVTRMQPLLARHGFRIAPLQSEWVAPFLGLPSDQVAEEFRVIDANGAVHLGADGYRCLLRSIPGLYPAYLLSQAPGLRAVFTKAYELVAKNRGTVSRLTGLGNACAVKPRVGGQAGAAGTPNDEPEAKC